jgi:hypothetical protein
VRRKAGLLEQPRLFEVQTATNGQRDDSPGANVIDMVGRLPKRVRLDDFEQRVLELAHELIAQAVDGEPLDPFWADFVVASITWLAFRLVA